MYQGQFKNTPFVNLDTLAWLSQPNVTIYEMDIQHVTTDWSMEKEVMEIIHSCASAKKLSTSERQKRNVYQDLERFLGELRWPRLPIVSYDVAG